MYIMFLRALIFGYVENYIDNSLGCCVTCEHYRQHECKLHFFTPQITGRCKCWKPTYNKI